MDKSVVIYLAAIVVFGTLFVALLGPPASYLAAAACFGMLVGMITTLVALTFCDFIERLMDYIFGKLK